jgi:hypothetical protein
MNASISQKVMVGDIYTQKEAHGIKLEVFVFAEGRTEEHYDCLVTVEKGSNVIASKVVTLPEHKIANLERTGFQAVKELAVKAA